MKNTTNILLILLMLWSIISPNAPIEALVSEESLGYEISAQPADTSHLVTVKDFKVYDGDTADFILDRKDEPSIKARFLLIDAPEMNRNVPYKKEARDRVIELFEHAELIQIEYEGKPKDHYKRDLVHVWVDGILLQEVLVKEGYAVARYIHDYLPNSQYADIIFDSQDYAQREALNVWKDGDDVYLANAEYRQGTPTIPADASETDETIAAPPDDEERLVYIAPDSGTKYHFDPNCRALKKANFTNQLTLSEALAQGYSLCGHED